jgi:quercetin dioxygenase-like cupin family protein
MTPHEDVTQLVRRMDVGEPDQWDDQVRGRITVRTIFSGELTPTKRLSAGIAEIAPGDVFRPHRHPQTEVYLVLAGEGVLSLGDETTALATGDAVFLPADRVHGVRNPGRTPLRMFYVMDADRMDEVEYDFVGDTRAAPAGSDDRHRP